LEVIQGHRGW